MPINLPTTFRDALQYLAERHIMPTSMNTAQLRQLGTDIRQKSFFSAGNMMTDTLDAMKERVGAMARGELSESSARAELQEMFDRLQYEPQKPGIQDLSSDARVRLDLETNLAQAMSFGQLQQGNDSGARYQFPAWELVRLEQRMEPRDWPSRWQEAGGDLTDGRMVALKGDQVWEALGDSGLFDDALDTAYPPFAYNSGMGWAEVGRDEAIQLGVLDPGETPPEDEQRFFDEAAEDKATTDELGLLRQAIKRRIGELAPI